jgi:hypothetical protein
MSPIEMAGPIVHRLMARLPLQARSDLAGAPLGLDVSRLPGPSSANFTISMLIGCCCAAARSTGEGSLPQRIHDLGFSEAQGDRILVEMIEVFGAALSMAAPFVSRRYPYGPDA